MRCYTVYKHINKKNGKAYVGITNQPVEKRWANGKGYIKCRRFYSAIKKYGWNTFEHKIVASNLSKQEAIALERKIIKEEQLTNNKYGYNLTDGGEHFSANEETRKKQSEYRKSLKGKMPKHMRDAISQGLKGNTISRKRVAQFDMHTGEQIATYPSLTIAGIETNARPCNISLACKGKIKTSMGFIWKYVDDNSPIYIETHAPKSKATPVCQFDKSHNLISKFSSVAQASKSTKVDQSAIVKVCKGKNYTAGGFLWEYAEK